MFFQNITFGLLLTAGAIFCEGTPKRSEKIVGGWTADPGEFPYQVSLRLNGRHFCGGAIISDSHILTAAHCVEDLVKSSYEYTTVISGSNQLSRGGQSHKICRVIQHPKYMAGPEYAWHNDIAIITLAEPITFDSLRKTIGLPSGKINRGAPGIIAGWGLVSTNFRSVPDSLQKMPTTVYPSSVCERLLSSHIHKEQICAIQPAGRGVCMGDSGGPLVVNGEVVGIASWVVPCARGYPDVFTNVYPYKEFIQQEMKKC